MRKITLIMLFILSFATDSISQKLKTVRTAVVSGQFTPAPRGFFILQHHGISDTVSVGSDGKFTLGIEQPDANYYTISIGKQSLTFYLLPEDSLKMELHGQMLAASPKFSGKSAAYCNYLAEQKKNDKTNAQYGRMGSLTPEQFREESLANRKTMEDLIMLEAQKHGFQQDFVSLEKEAIKYHFANANLLYKFQFEKAGNLALPQDIADAAYSGDLGSERMRFHEQFQGYAGNLVNYKANLKYEKSEDKDFIRYCEFKVDEVCSIPSQANRDILFHGVMSQILQDAGAQDIRGVVARFESCCTDEKLKARVRKVMAQYASLYPGEMAPDAACFDSAGKQIRLSDLRGKVIYIDAWATWCGPCKREIPELKKLEADFHDKNVQFVSISTDKDLNAWKNFLRKQEMTGMQLHQSEDMSESISMLYMVNSIPRFIVIDEEGRIVSADAARPSSGQQVRDLLNGVLND